MKDNRWQINLFSGITAFIHEAYKLATRLSKGGISKERWNHRIFYTSMQVKHFEIKCGEHISQTGQNRQKSQRKRNWLRHLKEVPNNYDITLLFIWHALRCWSMWLQHKRVGISSQSEATMSRDMIILKFREAIGYGWRLCYLEKKYCYNSIIEAAFPAN